MAKRSFRHEALLEPGRIRELLAALCEGLEAGSLHFADGEDEIALEPDGLIQLRLSASHEQDGRNRVTLRLNWQDPVAADSATSRLEIGGG